jgi:hypothetical protein
MTTQAIQSAPLGHETLTGIQTHVDNAVNAPGDRTREIAVQDTAEFMRKVLGDVLYEKATKMGVDPELVPTYSGLPVSKGVGL